MCWLRSNWITFEARDELSAAYQFLRRVEHRLQMVADEQTHALPDNAEAVERFAWFLGYEIRAPSPRPACASSRSCRATTRSCSRATIRPARQLPAIDYSAGPDDQRLLNHLTALGFKKPAAVAQTVQRLDPGDYRVFRNEPTRTPSSNSCRP